MMLMEESGCGESFDGFLSVALRMVGISRLGLKILHRLCVVVVLTGK